MWWRENFELTENNRSILKRIRLKFRVDYDAEAGGRVLLKRNDVKTCCLLERIQKAKDYVEIGVDANVNPICLKRYELSFGL